MKNIHNISSVGGNYYLYNMEECIFQLIHPEMNKIFSRHVNKTEEVSLYYINKYKYWINNNIFIEKNVKNEISTLNDSIVKNSLLSTPQLTFEVTEKCNLKCSYCIYSDIYSNHDHRESKNMNFSMAKNIIDYYFYTLKENNHANEKLDIGFYGGETLLNFELVKSIVSYLKTKYADKCKYNFHITTNGVYLNLYYDFLIKNEFNILISLDGDEKSSSYRFGHKTYVKIIKNINYIKEKYPIYFENNINFNAVLHNRNSIDSINNFFISNYNKTPIITPLNPFGINPVYKKAFRSIESSAKNKNTKNGNKLKFITEYSKLTKSIFGAYSDYLDLLSDKRYTRIIPTGTCLPFGKKTFITVKGKILPCERIGHNFQLGVINNEKTNIDFHKITNMYNNLYKLVYDKNCSKCYLFSRCSLCMFHIENNRCNSFCNKKGFNEYLKQKIDFFELHRDYIK